MSWLTSRFLPLKTALEYLDINPRLMLIIDDCSEKFETWMKYFKKTEENVFESILYRGRHNKITLVLAAHDDKIIDTKLRKNARVVIYTTGQSVITSFNKPGNGFSLQERKEAEKKSAKIFGEDSTEIKSHQKFCYIRDDVHPFRYTIANLYPDFDLGCLPLRELIGKMPKKDDDIASNPFVKNLIDAKPVKKHGRSKYKRD